MKRTLRGFLACLIMLMVLGSAGAEAFTTPLKIGVFNFAAVNLEAAGYGTMTANILMQEIEKNPGISVLDRRSLESFLAVNDLRQRDDLANVINIGSRLGLDHIVSGSVEKRGAAILVNCQVTSITEGRVIYANNLRVFTEQQLDPDVKRLSRMIIGALAVNVPKPQVAPVKRMPESPFNIRIRPYATSLIISWDEPPGGKAAGFELHRAGRPEGPFARIGSTAKPEYADLNLERDTTYYYRIRTLDEEGNHSPWSAVIAQKTIPGPQTPIILRAVGQIKSIVLTWSPGALTGGEQGRLRGYKLYRADLRDGPYREVANVLGRDLGLGPELSLNLDKILNVSFTDRHLRDGAEYFYRILAYNDREVESELSPPMNALVLPAVSGFSVQGGLIREVSLSFDHLDSPTVRGYFLYRSTRENSGFSRIRRIAPPASGYKLAVIDRDALDDAVTYYYYVTAFDENDLETSPSVTLSATTRGKPQTPHGLQGLSGQVKQAQLRWQPSLDTDVEGYLLYVSREREGKYQLLRKIEGRGSTSFTHGGFLDRLEDGTQYFYLLASYNRVGVESEPTAPVAIRTKARPSRPEGLAGISLRVKEIPLRWARNPERDISSYRIFRAEGARHVFEQVAQVTTTSYVDKNLRDGVFYIYRLQAEDRDGLVSDSSETLMIQTKPLPRPPEGLKAEVGELRTELRWSPSPEADIAFYVIYHKRLLGMDRIGQSSSPNFIDSPIPRGRSRTYVVTALDRDGLESPPSQELRLLGR